MDKVRNPSNSVCYTPSSEPYRVFSKLGKKAFSLQAIPNVELFNFPNLVLKTWLKRDQLGQSGTRVTYFRILDQFYVILVLMEYKIIKFWYCESFL
jgi:hypothetical protein